MGVEGDAGSISRRQFIGRGVAGASVLGAGGLLAACGGGSDQADRTSGSPAQGAPVRGGVLRVSYGDATTNDVLDPAKLITSFQAFAGGVLFDNLVRLDTDFVAHPGLAEDFSSTADARRWTFKLREAEFSDGRPVTAGDVRWSLQRLLDPDLGSGALALFSPYVAQDGIRARGDDTVELRLESPNAFLPILLGGYFARILPEGTSDFARPIGSGPFTLDAFEAGARFEVSRNPTYWEQGRPYLEGLRVAIIQEQSTKLQSVLSGGADVADAIEYSAVPQAEGNGAVALVSAPGGGFPIVVAPGELPQFKDPRVGQALKHAIDRERIVREVYYGRAQVSPDIPTPPSDPLFPSFEPYPYDPERARALLREAGAEGLQTPLWTSQVSPGLVDTAVVFREVAKTAGITFDVQTKPPSSYYTLAADYKRPFMDFWLRQHPSIFLPALYGTGGVFNETQFADEQFDQSVARAVAATDEATQRERFEDAHAIVNERASGVIPCHGDRIWVASRKVGGLELDWSNVADMREAYLT